MTIGKRSGQDKQPERPKRTQGCASTLTERSATIKNTAALSRIYVTCHQSPILTNNTIRRSRVEDKFFYRYSAIDSEDGIYLSLSTFKMVRETPCYYMVRQFFVTNGGFNLFSGKERRVPKSELQCRTICHTKERALHQFRIRQEYRIGHAKRSEFTAGRCLDFLQANNFTPTDEYTLILGRSGIKALGY